MININQLGLISIITGLICSTSAQAYTINQTPLLSQQQIATQVMAEFVHVPAGSFEMGTDTQKFFDLFADNTPKHQVSLSGFYIQKYLVNGTLFNSYLKIQHQNKKLTQAYQTLTVNDYAANANWQTANNFCHWLGQQTGLPMSLATEAQWEYAARAGGKNINYPTNNGKLELGKNYPTTTTYQQTVNGYKLSLVPVNGLPVNQLGIHQMGGNTLEWVNDWYSKSYYEYSPINNPQGPTQGKEKVIRGLANISVGMFMGYDKTEKQKLEFQYYSGFSVYSRGGYPPSEQIGFRCVINSDKPLAELKAIANRNLSNNTK